MAPAHGDPHLVARRKIDPAQLELEAERGEFARLELAAQLELEWYERPVRGYTGRIEPSQPPIDEAARKAEILEQMLREAAS